MARVLDPRSDIVFKRIFGEHPEILRDFLNAVLPFEDESQFATELEYLPGEQVPDLPLSEDSMVAARCKDAAGHCFIVEMRMEWTSFLPQRALFSASKAYVRQLERGGQYGPFCPVWGLSLLDATFHRDPETYYHDYRIVADGEPGQVREGLRLVFVELPKYRETHPQEACKLRWAWLTFLREAGQAGRAEHPTAEGFRARVCLNEPLRQALQIAEECGFTPAQLERYDSFWDAVSSKRIC